MVLLLLYVYVFVAPVVADEKGSGHSDGLIWLRAIERSGGDIDGPTYGGQW